jgi:ketosteroid isomerase-like protein
MSQETLQVMQAFFDAWNAGDMDAVGEIFAPDVVVRAPEGWPEAGVFVGREEVVRQLTENRSVWHNDALEPAGPFIDVADRVLGRYVWHGAGHGPEARLELTFLVTIRREKIVALEYFWDHAQALEAVGLSEQDARAGQ